MPKFSIVVKNKEGKTFKNIFDAPTKQALIDKLQKQDYFVVGIQEVGGASPGPGGGAPSSPLKRKQKKFQRKKIKLDDKLTFARQLATMLESGVTLTRALDVIQAQVQSEEFSKVVKKVKADIEQGASLSQSLAKHPKVFDPFWVSLAEVGEASGTIPVVLNKLVYYLEQEAAFNSTIISGIIYPAILFCVSMGAVAFFALFVGPRFEAVFNSMQVDLPLITRVLLSAFKFIKTNIIKIIAVVAVVVFLLKKYVGTHNGKTKFEHLLFQMPVIGEVYKTIIIERFSSQMAILIDAGVPILYALDITERLVNNNTCALVVANIKEEVRRGELLVAPMEKSGFFPPLCIQMILVGEETGELSKMLKHVADFYKYAVETFMKRFATIIEPFMLVFMGVVIGTIVIAMFLPMFDIAKLGGG